MVLQRFPAWLRGQDVTGKLDEWRCGPLCPDVMTRKPDVWCTCFPYPHVVRQKDSLAKIAAKVAETFRDFSGLDLAEYNWNTRDPEEINWFLEAFCGCNVPDRNHANWTFRYREPPTPGGPDEWRVIWIPRAHYGPDPRPEPEPSVTREQEVTLETGCTFLSEDGTCEADGEHVPCKAPHADWAPNTTVDIGDGPGILQRLLARVVEMQPKTSQADEQRLRESGLAFEEFDVLSWFDPVRLSADAGWVRPPGRTAALKAGVDFEWTVQSLAFHLDRVHVKEVSKADTDAARKFAAPEDVGQDLSVPPIDALGREAAAKALQDLYVLSHAGVLTRLVLRGCASQDECGDAAKTCDLSRRRAEWVRDEIRKRKILAAGVEVVVVPCSDWHNGGPGAGALDRRVAVEARFGPPPKAVDDQPPMYGRQFVVETYTNLHTKAVSRRLLYSASEGSGLTVASADQYERLRKGALGTLALFRQELLTAFKVSAETEPADLKRIEAWIRTEWGERCGPDPPRLTHVHLLGASGRLEPADGDRLPTHATKVVHYGSGVVDSPGEGADWPEGTVNHARSPARRISMLAATDDSTRMRIRRWAQSPQQYPIEPWDFLFDENWGR